MGGLGLELWGERGKERSLFLVRFGLVGIV